MGKSKNTEQDDTTPTPAPNSVPAVTPTEQEVQFINAEVLQPQVTPITGMAKPLADQAAAMMIQDTQSFLQGNEQVLTIAIAQAAALMLNETTAATGKAALEEYAKFLGELATYSAQVGTTASGIASSFQG